MQNNDRFHTTRSGNFLHRRDTRSCCRRIVDKNDVSSNRVSGENGLIHLPFDKAEIQATAGRQSLPQLIEPLTIVLIRIDPSDRWKCRLIQEGNCAESPAPNSMIDSGFNAAATPTNMGA